MKAIDFVKRASSLVSKPCYSEVLNSSPFSPQAEVENEIKALQQRLSHLNKVLSRIKLTSIQYGEVLASGNTEDFQFVPESNITVVLSHRDVLSDWIRSVSSSLGLEPDGDAPEIAVSLLDSYENLISDCNSNFVDAEVPKALFERTSEFDTFIIKL